MLLLQTEVLEHLVVLDCELPHVLPLLAGVVSAAGQTQSLHVPAVVLLVQNLKGVYQDVFRQSHHQVLIVLVAVGEHVSVLVVIEETARLLN